MQRFKDLVAKVWQKIDVSGLGQLTISEFEKIFKDEAAEGHVIFGPPLE